MELKEFIKIIRNDIKLFIAVAAVMVVGVFVYFTARPVSYGTSLVLNITRIGTQETADFRYDDFYRLQADEKFAETVAEWLKSPRIAADIYADSDIDTKKLSLRDLSKSLKPEKVSSQVVRVNFQTPDENTAGKLAGSVSKIISKNTEDLNKDQKNGSWFKVLAKDPLTVKNDPDYSLIFLAALLFGIFSAFWVVMIKYYLR